MEKPFTVPQLKKQLNDLDRGQLISLISDLYKVNKSAKEMLNIQLQGSTFEDQIYEEYKEKMVKIIYPKRWTIHDRVGFQAKKLKDLIAEFKRLKPSTRNIILLEMLFILGGIEYANAIRFIDKAFCNHLNSMYSSITTTLIKQDDHDLFEEFKADLATFIGETDWGVGVAESFNDSYMDLLEHFE